MKHYEEVVTLTCSEKYRRLWHSCFPVDFAKFSRTSFLQKNSGQKQPPEVFCKKRCSFKFRKIHLCQSLFFNKVAGLRPSSYNTSGSCFCLDDYFRKIYFRNLFTPYKTRWQFLSGRLLQKNIFQEPI